MSKKTVQDINDAIDELTIEEVVEIQDHCDEIIQAAADEEDENFDAEDDE